MHESKGKLDDLREVWGSTIFATDPPPPFIVAIGQVSTFDMLNDNARNQGARNGQIFHVPAASANTRELVLAFPALVDIDLSTAHNRFLLLVFTLSSIVVLALSATLKAASINGLETSAHKHTLCYYVSLRVCFQTAFPRSNRCCHVLALFVCPSLSNIQRTAGLFAFKPQNPVTITRPKPPFDGSISVQEAASWPASWPQQQHHLLVPQRQYCPHLPRRRAQELPNRQRPQPRFTRARAWRRWPMWPPRPSSRTAEAFVCSAATRRKWRSAETCPLESHASSRSCLEQVSRPPFSSSPSIVR